MKSNNETTLLSFPNNDVGITYYCVLYIILYSYAKLIENSRDAVRAHQGRGDIYGELDKVQRRRTHVDGANRGGFFARLLESRFNRVDVNFQDVFPEELRDVGDGKNGEFEDEVSECGFEEDDAQKGEGVAVLRCFREEEDWGE